MWDYSFFFKQKTAYEMRISDWSSDVCSSDLLVGVSTDSEFVHLAWRQSREDLGKVGFPWLADIKKQLATACGVLDDGEGVALRATFIVDPEGVIRYSAVNDLSVGRSPDEVLRVLDALQTDELCPRNWKKGDETLQAA